MSKKKHELSIRSFAAEYLTIITASGKGGVEAVYADEDLWLSQKMMGTLYGVDVRTVNEHLKTSLPRHQPQKAQKAQKMKPFKIL